MRKPKNRPNIEGLTSLAEVQKVVGCTSKKAYESEEEAEIICKKVRKKTGAKIHSYHCKWCDLYHCGHNRSLKKVRIRQQGFKQRLEMASE